MWHLTCTEPKNIKASVKIDCVFRCVVSLDNRIMTVGTKGRWTHLYVLSCCASCFFPFGWKGLKNLEWRFYCRLNVFSVVICMAGHRNSVPLWYWPKIFFFRFHVSVSRRSEIAHCLAFLQTSTTEASILNNLKLTLTCTWHPRSVC